jgi:hypothetical protein
MGIGGGREGGGEKEEGERISTSETMMGKLILGANLCTHFRSGEIVEPSESKTKVQPHPALS